MANVEKEEASFKNSTRVLLLEGVKQYAGNNEHLFDTHSVIILDYVDKAFKKCEDAGIDIEGNVENQNRLRAILGLVYTQYFHSLDNENEYNVNGKVSINDMLDSLLLTNFGIEKDTTRKPAN